jgi:putative inorganic carbon (HCO3(-)) transporter
MLQILYGGMIVSAIIPLATPYWFLAPVPVIGMVGLMVLHRHPSLGYAALVFLIPFGSLRKIGDVNVPWLIAGGMMLVLFMGYMQRKEWPRELKAPVFTPLLLVFLTAISTALFASHNDAMKNAILHGAALVFVFLGVASITPHFYRDTLPKVLVSSSLISVLMALAGSVLGISIFSLSNESGTFVRSVGGALDANNLSLMTVFVIPILVHRMFHARDVFTRMLMMGALPLYLLAIVTTLSRSGFLALLLCLTLLVWHYGRRFLHARNLGVLLTVGLLGMVVMQPMIPASFWERQASLGKWEDSSLGRRSSYLLVAWRAFKDSPVFGHGPGGFYHIYADSYEARQFARKDKELGRRAHNTYLEILVGMGLVGLGFYLWALAISLRQFFRAERIIYQYGDWELVDLTASYRISFMSLMAFLMVFSEEHHKYLLLALPLAQAAFMVAQREGEVTSLKDGSSR